MKIIRILFCFSLVTAGHPARILIVGTLGWVGSLVTLKIASASHIHEGHDDWNPISAGPVTTWTAPLCGKGKFVAQPFLFYNHTRGTFDKKGDYNALIEGGKKLQYQQQLFFQYGLTDRLEIDAQTVYQENYARQNGKGAHHRGFGDSYLFLRYCAIEEDGNLPHITGLFQLKLSTGKFQKLDPNKLETDKMGATSGGGSYDHGYGIMLTKKLRPFLLHADAIANFPQEVKVDGIETKYDEYLNYDFGIEYFLPRDFNLMLEFNGFSQGGRRQAGLKSPGTDVKFLTMGAGIGLSSKKCQTLLAYQRTLVGTNTDANDSMVLTLVYTF